jgi:thymidine kinase
MTMKKSNRAMHMIAAIAAFSAMGTHPKNESRFANQRMSKHDFQEWARRKIEEEKAKRKKPNTKKTKKQNHVFAVDYRKGKKPVFK